jgi:uncharacterized membrane protein
MLYELLKLLHVVAIVVWVGGMFFAHFFLRPALGQLDIPTRLKFMHQVLGRFFKAVIIASVTTLVTGYWMIGRVARASSEANIPFAMPLSWTIMAVLGTVMVLLFFHIRFALYKRFTLATFAQDWDAAAKSMQTIRTWVSINLLLGIVTLLVALSGNI